MVEGLIEDIKTGQFPNMIKERGLAMEWKYNQAWLEKKQGTLAVAGLIVLAILKRKK
jgi:hypothetical protein